MTAGLQNCAAEMEPGNEVRREACDSDPAALTTENQVHSTECTFFIFYDEDTNCWAYH